jgi:hypothetical protein
MEGDSLAIATKEKSGLIGIFWYDDDADEIESFTEELASVFIPLEKAKDENSYVIGSLAHFPAWTADISTKHGGVDYKYYPRGRVVYYPKSGTYKIFCDKCISDSVLTRIKKAFCLDNDIEVIDSQGYDNAKNKLARSGHYQCHLCKRTIFK